MEFLTFNRPTLAPAATWLGATFVTFVLTLTPPGKAQMLMNLAPQALPTSSVGPSYAQTLSAVKQSLTTPAKGPNPSQPPGADAAPASTPTPPAAAPAPAACELKVSQMNDIQHHKVVRVSSGPCLMVFNAND
jgi:hypothetical protein